MMANIFGPRCRLSAQPPTFGSALAGEICSDYEFIMDLAASSAPVLPSKCASTGCRRTSASPGTRPSTRARRKRRKAPPPPSRPGLSPSSSPSRRAKQRQRRQAPRSSKRADSRNGPIGVLLEPSLHRDVSDRSRPGPAIYSQIRSNQNQIKSDSGSASILCCSPCRSGMGTDSSLESYSL
jgi:hypothetical protein